MSTELMPTRYAGRTHRDVFVLSGGAARGAVQVGMAEALLDHGVVPCGLVGTSVGALNAAFLAGGPTRARVAQLRDAWLGLGTRDVFPGSHLGRIAHVARHRSSLYSSTGLARVIRSWSPTARIEDLPVPLRVTTTHLASGRAVYHRAGDLARTLLASAAVPAIFDPVTLEDAATGRTDLHVDGGIADLVPVHGVLDLVADVAPTRVFVLDASVPARVERARSPLHVLVTSLEVAMRVRAFPTLDATVEVHHLRAPDLGTGMRDFSRTPDHLALGRRAVDALLSGTPGAPVAA